MGKSSAQKRHEQSEKRRLRNRSVRTRVRTGIRSFNGAVSAGDLTAAEKELSDVTRRMDAAVGKGVYHHNTVARTKSRLSRKLNSLRKSS